MEKVNILWVDDEVDLLKPHILFLKEKGYDVQTINNGNDALDLIEKHNYDIVFLDENMPGLSGLETLNRIKEMKQNVPVVMITKSEEEHIMEDAIGSKIADYLIKPVKPNQILLALKKILDNKRIVSEKTTIAYQQEFRSMMMRLSERLNFEEWVDVYKKLVYWEMELDKAGSSELVEILNTQKEEANSLFSKFIENNYENWLKGRSSESPIMSHTAFKSKVVPLLERKKPVYLIVIDNLRYDQWKMIQPVLEQYYKVEKEEVYYSILPTATQFSRNAFFAGLMPSEIEKRHPKLWVNEDEEGGKNMNEAELMAEQLKRLGKNIKTSYNKITNHIAGKRLAENIKDLAQNDLNVIVYNFVDMLSHARTDMEVIRELAQDEAAYRSITLSWFEHSPLHDIMKKISEEDAVVALTTDHGTIKVKEPSKVIGDKNTSTNLRYKQGKNLNYNPKEVFEVNDPAQLFLPKINVSTRYIFAKESKFFAYPNNYNYYVNFYKNTFQHGGISLEEVLIPFVVMG